MTALILVCGSIVVAWLAVRVWRLAGGGWICRCRIFEGHQLIWDGMVDGTGRVLYTRFIADEVSPDRIATRLRLAAPASSSAVSAARWHA